MSDTPQCDDWFGEAQDFQASAFVVSIENARTLERDNARLQARVGELGKMLQTVLTPGFFSSPRAIREGVIAEGWKLLEDK